MIFFIIYEAIADNQHWKFQSEKRKRIHDKEKLEGEFKKGFLDKGLSGLSRHPNYFAEQAIWVSLILVKRSVPGNTHYIKNIKKKVPRFFGWKKSME